MAAAWWEGRVSAGTCLRVWVVSWFGNMTGESCWRACSFRQGLAAAVLRPGASLAWQAAP
jgi:formate/nitrite transporter FocA (FNT family)